MRDVMREDASEEQTAECIGLLCDALASPHCRLVELNVQGFGFSPTSVLRLVPPLQRPGCSLQTLVLARWAIPVMRVVDDAGSLAFGGASGCEEDVVLFCHLLRGARGGRLRSLDLSPIGVGLGIEGVIALASTLEGGFLGGLASVSLKDVPFRRPQLLLLLRALLSSRCPLESLDLSGTSLCLSSQGRYSTDALRVVCALLAAPDNRLRRLALRGTYLCGLPPGVDSGEGYALAGIGLLCEALADDNCVLEDSASTRRLAEREPPSPSRTPARLLHPSPRDRLLRRPPPRRSPRRPPRHHCPSLFQRPPPPPKPPSTPPLRSHRWLSDHPPGRPTRIFPRSTRRVRWDLTRSVRCGAASSSGGRCRGMRRGLCPPWRRRRRPRASS